MPTSIFAFETGGGGQKIPDKKENNKLSRVLRGAASEAPTLYHRRVLVLLIKRHSRERQVVLIFFVVVKRAFQRVYSRLLELRTPTKRRLRNTAWASFSDQTKTHTLVTKNARFRARPASGNLRGSDAVVVLIYMLSVIAERGVV